MKRMMIGLLMVFATLEAMAQVSESHQLSNASAQQRRPIDNEHPLWLIHVDVWFAADPQKIIDLIPEDVRPYVCMNLSMSCAYDKEKNIYTRPRSAVRTYKSWGSVCQKNGVWFTCQPASGGHTHIQDSDLETFEYFFKRYPNFLGWNYAEQFWGFDEPGDKSSSRQSSRWALFANLVEMSHKYGGFLTVSFCGNIWSHPLNPIGEMKREPKLLEACKKYPESILWLYKYTTSSCFYNNESVTIAPFISGLAKNYGVRYDYCGWEGAMSDLKGEGKCKYPGAAGIGTVMEQTGINGGAVWDGPELTWTQGGEGFTETNSKIVDGYSRRNWAPAPHFKAIWTDMFRKVIDGTLRIPTRKEVVDRTKIVVVNDVNTGSDEDKYAAWGNLYDKLYKQDDPMNKGNGQWMENYCYFKKTGRYATIPVTLELYDDLAKSIPVQVQKSKRTQQWSNLQKKVDEFNEQYPEVSTGDLFVARMGNQLVTYTPYSYLNKKTTAEGRIPLAYNTCDSLILNYGKLSSGVVREYNDHIDFYLNNFRTDTTTTVVDVITVKGVSSVPSYTLTLRESATAEPTEAWDAANGVYTLSVNHLGPVDVTIQCAGINSRPAVSVAQSLAIPQQPAESHLPIVIEAENMDYKSVSGICFTTNGKVPDDVNDFAALGYVSFSTSKNGSLRHQLTLDKAGDYIIAVRYSQTTKAGKMEVVVNGETQSIDIEETGKNNWLKSTFKAHLNEGSNDLRLNNTDGIGMYIDQIIYTSAEAEAEKFLVCVRETEHGSVVSDVEEAAEGETVTLTVNPDEGYVLTELRVINSVYFTMEKTITFDPDADVVTFVMTDDNAVILPVFEKKSVIDEEKETVFKLDFTNVAEGAMPKGWLCVQENDDVHQYPNTYSLGARTFVGFQGCQGSALYWRNGKTETGSQTNSPLTLEPGCYKLVYVMAAWKEDPQYKVELLDAAGRAVVTSQVQQAAPNVKGERGDVSSAERRELPFIVTEKGNFVIRFTDESTFGGFHEFLLLECKIITDTASGIRQMTVGGAQTTGIYELQGRKVQSPRKGQILILRSTDGKTKKMIF